MGENKIEDWLDKNGHPSVEEFVELQAALIEANKTIEELNSEIADLEDKFDDLEYDEDTVDDLKQELSDKEDEYDQLLKSSIMLGSGDPYNKQYLMETFTALVDKYGAVKLDQLLKTL